MMYGYEWGMPMMWFVWIPAVILVVWLLVRKTESDKQNMKKESPLDILKRRYANGEITTEEYEERRKKLD